jgi:hypothetical protein
LSYALPVDVQRNIPVTACKGNGISHVACTRMAQNEIHISMFADRVFVVAYQREAVSVLRLDSRPAGVKEDRQSKSPTLLVDWAKKWVIRIDTLHGWVDLDRPRAQRGLSSEFYNGVVVSGVDRSAGEQSIPRI